MNSRSGLVAATVAALIMVLVSPSAVVLADDHVLPGMCSGRWDANLVINAQAHGDMKYVLNVETDDAGQSSGALVLGRGPSRLFVDEICRAWQHQPGQDYGECAVDEGVTVVHAVGVGELADGTRVLARTDARETEEGIFFRVRHRPLREHHETSVSEHEDDGCSDDSWTRWPAQGWAPLDRLHVHNL